MIDNFQIFGIEHILSIFIPVTVGLIFIFIAKKYPKKQKIIAIVFAIFILLVRFTRYGFDLSLGIFNLTDLLSLHICNIDLYLLIYCLIWPKKSLFSFCFLIGIPTALSVVLMPGKIHPEPGMLRAIFFIMSHTLLVMGAVYLAIIHKFELSKRNLAFYYLFSLVLLISVLIFNSLTGGNFMYLMGGPDGTILKTMFDYFGQFGYLTTIYLLVNSLITLVFFIYKYLQKNTKSTTAIEKL